MPRTAAGAEPSLSAPRVAPPVPAAPLPVVEAGPAPPTPQPGPERGAAQGSGAGHYRVELAAPLLVAVDNARSAFPQEGLALARRVYELPVEGGVTRLLLETRGGEQGRVGPVRSARVAMLDLADALGAFLVHVGGSPAALARIEREGYVTFDGLFDRARFVRVRGRRPPHNTFVDLGAVRAELRRLGLDRVEVRKGAAYRPAADTAPGRLVRVRFAPDYVSTFRFQKGVYRWWWNGRVSKVGLDAVVILYVRARVRDEEGRLDLDLSSGEGALYLGGRYQPVRYRLEKGGFALTDTRNRSVDLTPYRVWFLLVPPWARVE